MKFTSRVPVQRDASLLLADYLTGRFTYHDRAGWMALISGGRLTIDGKNATVNDTVRGGEIIAYDAGEFDEPSADLRYSVVYEDEWIIAVSKPGDLLVHRAGKSFRHNLMFQLRFNRTPPSPTARCIHRLDRHASGVVLIAKTPEIQAEISALFETRQVGKNYIAYVHGIPNREDRIINKPIGKDPAATTRPKFRIDESGKEAISHIEQCTPIGTSFARLLISPLTGRTHQLRVHCASIGHPIVGDTLYGSDMRFPDDPFYKSAGGGQIGPSSRHALHCLRIRFFHPRLQRKCDIEAPLPLDMIRLEYFLIGNKKGPAAPFQHR